MNTNEILPVLDTAILKEKANEFAMKGAIETIKEYYSGYNSPYRKAIEEELKNKTIGYSLELPDIIALLNDSLSNEIDAIANAAVAKTFIPIVKKLLTREPAEIKMSEFLKQFVDDSDFGINNHDMDDYDVFEERNDGTFVYLEISNTEKKYRLGFHKQTNDGVTYHELFTLPEVNKIKSTNRFMDTKTMKISVDGVTLELPFTKDILSDNFTSYVARLIIAKTRVIFDNINFTEDMFPESCHCH
jgi:hypothetical protein